MCIRDSLIDCFKSLMPMCLEHNVTLAIENHGGYPGTAAEVKAVVQGVADEHFVALFDTGNWLGADEDPVKAARELAGMVGPVHVKDMVRLPADTDDPEAHKPVRASYALKAVNLGEGEVPNAEILQVLKDAGFDSVVTVEAEGAGDETANATAALDYLKGVIAGLK